MARQGSTQKDKPKKDKPKKDKPKKDKPAVPPTMAESPIYFAIPAGLAQATVDYLLTCPAGQVMGLIDGFKQLQRVELGGANEQPEGDN